MTSTHDTGRPNTTDPVYTIDHVAALFHVSVDRAREYTYRTDFPAAFALGARNLWDREEVLCWFKALPRRSRTTQPEQASDTPDQQNAGTASTNTDTNGSVRAVTPASPRPARSRGAARSAASDPASVRPIKGYARRAARSVNR